MAKAISESKKTENEPKKKGSSSSARAELKDEQPAVLVDNATSNSRPKRAAKLRFPFDYEAFTCASNVPKKQK
jgi:hypothetical protein